MVLSVQWLKVIWPVLWDFSNLIMEFKLNRFRIKLKGLIFYESNINYRLGFMRKLKKIPKRLLCKFRE